jgi:hypothetical protein
MNVLVVDSNPVRGENLKKLIGEEKCQHVQDTPALVPSDAKIVFLHSGREESQPRWSGMARSAREELWLVFYGGSNELVQIVKTTIGENNWKPRWIVVERSIGNQPEAENWDPKGFVNAIARGETNREKLLAILTGFDPVLEAKLNLLYACLEGGSVLDNFKHSEEWKLVKNLNVGQQSVESLLKTVQGDSISPDTLKALRDALLPEYPELQQQSNS